MERARAARPRLREDRVTLAHGAGGKATRTLVEAVFREAFGNPLLDRLDDSAVFPVDGAAGPALAFTTDASVVSPLFFPGGDIGDLAVNGTVNDLAVAGATPLHLSAAFILEEGFPVADLRRITASMRRAAGEAGVGIVAGDTKVVERGKADGCYITTSGVGVVESAPSGEVLPGDSVLVTGPIGEHGVTVMLARGDLGIEAGVASDTAPLNGLIADLRAACPGAVRRMRDATRGGVATVLNELAVDAGVAVALDEDAVPVGPAVRGACELLGLDPLYVACEGRAVIVVSGEAEAAALAALRAHPLGAGAAVIGRVEEEPPGLVLLKTSFGGTRVVDVLVGDPLPRIC
ncbi:hydrogenase expression/formation protein HypE [Actinomadura graeca]|uniref:Hydrogenase expression/formation protein HypE n=1 Tax=Actinomadura graeca TaxID=2750812 RepID=A0ABX8R6T0_9ACTN|nr:hydrogenase expression/formation protein HypE [Actinomadura graeca]